MSQNGVTTKDRLLTAIERGWRELDEWVGGLTEEELTGPKDAAGWTAKDHLIHLMAWECSALFFLLGKPRHRGLGISESDYQTPEEDINDIIFQQGRAQSLGQVLAEYRDVHQRLLAALQPLLDADLQKPYDHFLPDEAGERTERPAMDVVYYNSANHYAEHLAWMKALLTD